MQISTRIKTKELKEHVYDSKTEGKKRKSRTVLFHSVHFSGSVKSYSLRPHELQHARPPSITSSRSLPKLMSIESVMPSSHLILCRLLLLLPSIFPRIMSFLMSQFFTSGGQNIGASTSASIITMNIQD